MRSPFIKKFFFNKRTSHPALNVRLLRQIAVGLHTGPLKTTGPVAKLNPCYQVSEECVCVPFNL